MVWSVLFSVYLMNRNIYCFIPFFLLYSTPSLPPTSDDKLATFKATLYSLNLFTFMFLTVFKGAQSAKR